MSRKDKHQPQTYPRSAQLDVQRTYTLGELLDMCDQNPNALISITDETAYYDTEIYWRLTWLHTETPEEAQKRIAREQAQQQKRAAQAELRKQRAQERAAKQAAEQEASERALYEKLKAKFGTTPEVQS